MLQEQGGEGGKENKIAPTEQTKLPTRAESEQTLPQRVRQWLKEVIDSAANRFRWLTPVEQTQVAKKLRETGLVEDLEELEREKLVLAQRLNRGMSTLIGEKVFTDEELLQIAADSLYFNFIYSEDFKHTRDIPRELATSFQKAGERISNKIPLSQNQIEKVFNLKKELQNAEKIVNENYEMLNGTWKMLEYNKQKKKLGQPTIPEHDLNQDVLRLLQDKSIQLAFEKVQTEKNIEYLKGLKQAENLAEAQEALKAQTIIENSIGAEKEFYNAVLRVADGKSSAPELVQKIKDLKIPFPKDWILNGSHPVNIILRIFPQRSTQFTLAYNALNAAFKELKIRK